MNNYEKDLTLEWNIDDIFSSREDWLAKVDFMNDEITMMKQYFNNSQFDIIDLLDIDNNLRLIVNNIYTYAYVQNLNDMSNLQCMNDLCVSERLVEDYERQIINLIESIVASKDKVSDSKLYEINKEIYKYAISVIYNDSHNTTSLNGEQFDYIAPALSKNIEFYNLLMRFVDENENLLSNSDTANDFYMKYIKYEDLFKEILLSYILTSVGISRIEGFNRAIEYQLYLSDLDINVFDLVIKVASEGYYLCKEYYKVKKKYYMVDYLTLDKVDDPINLISNDYLSYSGIIDKLLSAFSILGEEYCSTMMNYLKNGRVKISKEEASNNNMTICSYDSDKVYINLNINCSINDLVVVAHEIGHAMYCIFTNRNQIVSYREINSFLHEIPAMLNELIILDYNVACAKNVNEEISYLSQLIEYYIAGYYISAIYSEFEDDIYKIVEKNEFFDTKLLNELMTEKLNNIYSDIIEDTSIISRNWIRVKQFYNSYYVFNYASSTAYAIIIYSKLKSDKTYYKKFIQFLKKGKSLSNKELIQMLDIEINDIEVYRTVNIELNKLLIEFNRLIEKYSQ